MEEYPNKFKVEIDYENQPFEDMEINPYEVVLAASKYARDINDKFRKFFGSDFDVQPRNLAMKKLESDSIKLIYDNEENDESIDEK